MATWADLAWENLDAAKLLLDKGYLRGSARRAYYAAYAALTGEFEKRDFRFSHGDRNPRHSQLLALAANNLDATRFGCVVRRRIKRASNLLQATRINADYSPRTTIDRVIARERWFGRQHTLS